MAEIREAARARYLNLSESGKKEVRDRFAKLDADGDGTVSRGEYAAYIKEKGYRNNLFDILDKSDDGKLDLDEFLTLDFIYNCRGYNWCGGCNVVLLGGVYFTCVSCYGAGNESFDLCCNCYGNKSFVHNVVGHHYFRDNHSLLQLRKPKPSPAAVKSTPSQLKMEELVKTAQIYYKTSSSEVKSSAKNFFNSLDSNKDGRVSLPEFLEFMREERHVKMSNHHFFKELDKDGSGTLDFMEVMALYYIIKSGRPFCGGCDEFISGMFFTCSKCFDEDENGSFCVCASCFESGEFVHKHKHQFLDNYALLEAKRKEAIAMRKADNANQHKPSSSVSISELRTSPSVSGITANNYNTTLVQYSPPKPENQGWKNAGKVALSVLDAAVKVATLHQFCTIM